MSAMGQSTEQVASIQWLIESAETSSGAVLIFFLISCLQSLLNPKDLVNIFRRTNLFSIFMHLKIVSSMALTACAISFVFMEYWSFDYPLKPKALILVAVLYAFGIHKETFFIVWNNKKVWMNTYLVAKLMTTQLLRYGQNRRDNINCRMHARTIQRNPDSTNTDPYWHGTIDRSCIGDNRPIIIYHADVDKWRKDLCPKSYVELWGWNARERAAAMAYALDESVPIESVDKESEYVLRTKEDDLFMGIACGYDVQAGVNEGFHRITKVIEQETDDRRKDEAKVHQECLTILVCKLLKNNRFMFKQLPGEYHCSRKLTGKFDVEQYVAYVIK